MSDLQVVPSELASVSTELDTLAESLRSGLGALDGEITQLLGGGWSGSAASAYTGVWQQWHQGATQVAEGLRQMATLLNEAAQRYSGTDNTAGGEIDGAGL